MPASSPLLRTLAEVYRTPGDYASVYADLSVDTGDPPQVREERRRSIADELRRSGAPDGDVNAVIDVLATAPGTGDDAGSTGALTAFVLVREGEVIVDELVPAHPLDRESTDFGPLPDVTPLLLHAVDSFGVLVVETARAGGSFTLRRVGRRAPDADGRHQGRTDTLHASKRGGGWRQDYFQSHAEEIWRQTQAELASEIDRVVRRHRPRLLVIAGDIAARGLLRDELSAEAQALVSILPSDQEADGSDPSRLEAFVDEEIGRLLRADEEALAEIVELHEGRGDNRVELTLGGVVHALASAQVESLLLDGDRLADRELLALDAAPWVAAAPEDALTAGVVATVPARLALLRAALLTDAAVHFTRSLGTDDSPVHLPGDAPVAALLRWTTGPAVPGVDPI